VGLLLGLGWRVSVTSMSSNREKELLELDGAS
jgi:hypothetical protein